jgi:hypothetical protein
MNETRSGVRAYGLILAAWVFALEYALYLIADDLPDKLIKLGAAFFMLFYLRYRHNEMNSREKALLILFYTLLLTALIPSTFIGDPLTGITQWMKIALMTTVLPLLLINRRMTQRNGELLASLYLWFGIIFSIQAILAFFAVMWGIVDNSVPVEIGRRPEVPEATMGILGYANAIRSPGSLLWLRPQGWFLEPSYLGAFLLLPAFLSLGGLLQYRKMGYLLSFLVIFVAMFMTVSLAVYLGFIVATFFLALSKLFYSGMSRVSSALKYCYPILILAAFLGVAISLVGLANKAFEVNSAELDEEQAVLTSIYARDPQGDSGNLFREVGKAEMYSSTILSNPLGIGFANTLGEHEITAANGLLFWGVAGGFPALILLVAFFGCVFRAFCHPLLISDQPVYQCIAASFIGSAIHNLSAGNWLEPYFLIHLAIVCMAVRQGRRFPHESRVSLTMSSQT